MANNRRRHAEQPVTDPLIDLYDIELPARFGSVVLRWTPGPRSSGGSNLLDRSAWYAAPQGWVTYLQTATTHGAARIVWGPEASLAGAGAFTRATLGDGAHLEWADTANRVSCEPGMIFGMSARMQAHRCVGRAILIWRNSSGAVAGRSLGSPIGPTDEPACASPEQMTPVSVLGTAPAGAVTVQGGFRVTGIAGGSTNPMGVAWQPMLSRLNAGTDPLPPYQPSSVLDESVSFGGVQYEPVPIGLSGFDVNSQGPIPRPRVVIPNVNNFARNLMATFGNLLGAKVTRRRAYRYALDGMERADPTDFYGPDMWLVDRIVMAGPELVEFELCSPLDLQGKQLPNRQVIRDICTHRYRSWNSATSSFTPGTCPYAGASYWKADGTASGNPAEDDCGRRLSDCSLRFPGQPLPTLAFPGVATRRR